MGTGLSIGDVSRRSGFPPPTLRYYERVGVLPPPHRTAAGYRAYDESVLTTLAFVARAKALGCSLEEIAELMSDWAGGRCAPVQDRLRALATAKLVRAQCRIDELVAFAGDLRRILATLGAHTPDGPCDADCGCLDDTSPPVPAAPPEPVSVATKERVAEERRTIVCTLEGGQIAGRLQDWKDLLGHVTGRTPLDGGLRLDLDEATPIEELVRLVRAEQSCCRFFSFSVLFGDGGTALEVRAPSAAQPVVDALFGPA